jgi:hypothetical protein
MYWNTNCRDIKGCPILSEIKADTMPEKGKQCSERRMNLLERPFCKFSWECPPLEGCIYLLFRRRSQTGEIRLNMDVDVVVPSPASSLEEPQNLGRYIRSLLTFLSSPD